ncbi:MAG: NAD(P)H-hydrate dehydratase [Coriobacteriales bacterium]|jgi:hydroxyethylthiazole kinase-like uncharacterized protein yjeF
MEPVMSVQETRDLERSLAERGVGPDELMKRAGAVVAMQAARLVKRGSVVVMCGTGNNGGDGWVCADHLARHGYDVSVVAAATPAEMGTETSRRMARRASEMGVPIFVTPDDDALARLLGDADVVVDACFGTGFHGELPQPFAGWVETVEATFLGQVVSVDVPSGVDATTGAAPGAHFRADYTVTMFSAKPGLLGGVGRAASGTVVVAGLISEREGLAAIAEDADTFALEERDYLDALPQPDPAQDKYTHGRVLVVAGSRRYPGAAVMAAMAAARSGAGYVTLAVPEPVVPIAQAHLLSVPVVGLPADKGGALGVSACDEVAELAGHADAVVAGPGLTLCDGACEVVRTLLASDAALVLDADALNAVARICAGSADANPHALRREAPLVLTPHRRELARLVGAEPGDVASLSAAVEASKRLVWAVGSSNLVVVAKGDVTAVTSVESSLIVAPGPEALATAGTGDVLAGVCAGALAQLAAAGPEGADPSDVLLCMAAADRAHAIAGELACEAHGSHGIVAPDVAESVGLAFDELAARSEREYLEYEGGAGASLQDELDFEDESRVEPSAEASAEMHAAATAGKLGQDDEPLEEPEAPERQQARLERAQRAAEVRRAKVAAREAPVPSAIEIPGLTGASVLAKASGEAAREEPQADEAAAPEGPIAGADRTTAMPPVSDAGSPAADAAEPSPEGEGGAPEDGEARDEAVDAPDVEAAREGDAEGERPRSQGADVPAASETGAVPPFLAQAIEAEAVQACRDAEEASQPEDEQTGGEAQGRFVDEPIDPEHVALEEFHKRATKHAGVRPKIPPKDRPSGRRGKSGE